MEILRNLDHTIFNYFNGFVGHNSIEDKIFIWLALYLIYFVPLILIIIWFWSKDTKKPALKATFAGILAWFGICNLIGTLYFRQRPFTALADTQELLFHRADRSFPSDHAAFLFALAFAFLFLGYKKISIGIFILAIIISIMRIIVGVHYPADILAGFFVGLIAAAIIWVFRKQLDIIFNPIINAAKKLRLA